jgi:autotransporter-associated beta strand protein
MSGIISGVSKQLTKTGAGTLSVSGVNTYSGDTVISAGVFTVATAGTLGGTSPATYAGGISIASGSTFTFASSATQTLSGVISGAGGLTKSTDSSTLTLSNTNSFEGITQITAGKISISNDRNLGAVPGSVVANQLTLNGGTLLASDDVSIHANRGITLGTSDGRHLLLEALSLA